jgi:prepilin-type N-terminal cleavage/methylation domain-containing protein
MDRIMYAFFKRRKKADRGLTLVETIVTVALFTILMTAVMGTISSFYRYNAYTLAQAYQLSNARRGVEFLIRDIREMTFADDGTFPLAVMDDHRIGFYSDIDRDDSVEYVEYELSSTTLMKRVYNATGTPPTYDTMSPDEVFTLSEYVQNEIQGADTFIYFDGIGQPAVATTTVTDIRYIEVQVIVNIDPVRDPGQFMLRSSAALRNLKSN